jgi:hypothetical protein
MPIRWPLRPGIQERESDAVTKRFVWKHNDRLSDRFQTNIFLTENKRKEFAGRSNRKGNKKERPTNSFLIFC